MRLEGLHHVTAVTADAPGNHAFYTGVLGMRMVKKTVNQDDTSAYHLFYADGLATPGSDLTFFDWPVQRERRGTNAPTRTGLRVAGEAALAWWGTRLSEHGITHAGITARDGRAVLDFEDPEGQRLSLVDDGGEGPAYPVALHATYKWFPDKERAIPTAVIAQGSAIGVVIAIPLLNLIITNYSWHYAFGALGIVGLLWVVAWAFLGKEGSIVESAAEQGLVAGARVPYRDLLLNPTNIASWCAYFGAYFGLALVLSWFTPYLVKGLGFDQATAGKLTALPFIVGFFVVIAGSWLSQRMMQNGSSSRSARGIVCGIAICLGGFALLAAPYATSVAMTIALIIAGTTLPSVVYILSPAILSEITPVSQRGAILAINSAVGTSAGIIAPYIMGSVIEGAASAAEGYSNGFTVCGVVTLIGGLIGLIFLRPENERAGFAARARAASLVARA